LSRRQRGGKKKRGDRAGVAEKAWQKVIGCPWVDQKRWEGTTEWGEGGTAEEGKVRG